MANKTITVEPTAMYFNDPYDGWILSDSVGNTYGGIITFSGINIDVSKIVIIKVNFTQTDSMGETGSTTLKYDVGYGYGTSFGVPSQLSSLSLYMSPGLVGSFNMPIQPASSIKGDWYIYVINEWEQYKQGKFIVNSIEITYKDENTISYCMNGTWVECVPYYGVNGSWIACSPYYGSGGNWVLCNRS